MSDARVANHEAGHALGFIMATERVPVEVRIDRPDIDILGHCIADLDEDEDLEYGHLIAFLMGPLAEGKVIHWPPSKDAPTQDERSCALLVELLKVSESRYKTALAFGAHYLGHCETKAMHALIAQALMLVPVLDRQQLTELLAPYLTKFNIAIEEGTPCPN